MEAGRLNGSFIRTFPNSLSAYLAPISSPHPITSNHSPPSQKQKSKYRSTSGGRLSRSISNKSGSIRNPMDIDSNGNKLVHQLQQHREKLAKKLHVHTMLYNLEHINKCIKHDCYMSAYDTKNNKLLCAVCFTQNKRSISKNSPLSAQSLILPLQKSASLLQTSITSAKSEIENQIMALKTIENILYEGFEEERKQLDKRLREIDDKYEQTIVRLREAQMAVKQSMLDQYREERNKHDGVIKQLGILRNLIQEYLVASPSEKQIRTKGIVNDLYLSPQAKKSQRKASSPVFQYHSNALPKSPTNLSDPLFKQLVFRHIAYNELSQCLKFSKSGLMWSKDKHRNKIAQISDPAMKQIDRICKNICQLSRKSKNQ